MVGLLSPLGEVFVLIGVYLITMVLGLFVSNNAAVLIMMGLVKSVCRQMDTPVKKGVLLLIYASNISFATPFSYQTNLMVVDEGKYTFVDFLRFGLPIQLVLMVVCLATITLLDSYDVYPFEEDHYA